MQAWVLWTHENWQRLMLLSTHEVQLLLSRELLLHWCRIGMKKDRPVENRLIQNLDG